MQLNFDNNNLKFYFIDTFQENIDIILNKEINSNNLNIFYMMMYNLDYEELQYYFLCEHTKDYFTIFDKNIDAEDFVRRYVFVNQFKLLKNTSYYDEISNSKDNYVKIKKEYEFYKKCYNDYLNIKEYIGIDDLNEKNIFGIFSSFILLKEYNYHTDKLSLKLLEQIKSKHNEDSDLFDTLLKIINSGADNEKLKFFKDYKNYEDLHIIQKICKNLNIIEEKIYYFLLLGFSFKDIKSEYNKNNFENLKNTFTKVVYKIFLNKIKNNHFCEAGENDPKISFIISRSNLTFQNNFNFGITDNNESVVTSNIRDIFNLNYFQEIKNYYYFYNSLSINSDKSDNIKIETNENCITNLLSKYHFKDIFSFYDSFESLYNLDNKIDYKFIANMVKKYEVKNVIEIITIGSKKMLKVKYSFGSYLYDLNSLLEEMPIIIQNQSQENIILDILETNKTNDEKIFYDYGIIYMKNLESSQIYINYLIKPNKFMTADIIVDFKLHHLYNFYNNFYAFSINMTSVKDQLSKNSKINIKSIPKESLAIFQKFIAKKVRISSHYYYNQKEYIFSKIKISRVLEGNKNLASLIYKYNNDLFHSCIVKKANSENFSRWKFASNTILTMLKLTKIFRERRAIKQIKTILINIINSNYETTDVDKLNEIKLNFDKNEISKSVPKLLSLLNSFKRNIKDYVSDLIFYEHNLKTFKNQQAIERIIAEKTQNLQMLYFLFAKKYSYYNAPGARRVSGILQSEFTKSAFNEVLILMKKLYDEISSVFNKYNMSPDYHLNYEIIVKLNSDSSFLMERRSVLQKKIGDNNNNNNNSINKDKNKFINKTEKMHINIPDLHKYIDSNKFSKRNEDNKENNHHIKRTSDTSFNFGSPSSPVKKDQRQSFKMEAIELEKLDSAKPDLPKKDSMTSLRSNKYFDSFGPSPNFNENFTDRLPDKIPEKNNDSNSNSNMIYINPKKSKADRFIKQDNSNNNNNNINNENDSTTQNSNTLNNFNVNFPSPLSSPKTDRKDVGNNKGKYL